MHMFVGSEWVNQRENVKIQFTYEPEKPIIYTFTELNFSVQNVQSGKHLKDLIAKYYHDKSTTKNLQI